MTTRVSKGERTRQRILDVAREAFAERGFDRTTIRAIADVASVDKAAVIQYFGSKDQLFREAIEAYPHEMIDLHFSELPLRQGDATDSLEALIRFSIGRWDNDTRGALARASFTSEIAAEHLRDVVTTQGITMVAEALDQPDARLRAALFAAFMFGLNAHRKLLEMPDLAGASEDEIARILAPAVEVLLGELRSDTVTAPSSSPRLINLDKR
ncbi:MAG TPA: TetR family transcriptional regulator [Solirubrobacteraceae bacterium]|nr:TetR family transcriptional regulator [Solirubrobacteraceae bacterium]